MMIISKAATVMIHFSAATVLTLFTVMTEMMSSTAAMMEASFTVETVMIISMQVQALMYSTAAPETITCREITAAIHISSAELMTLILLQLHQIFIQ